MTITMTGHKELDRYLDSLPDRVVKQGLRTSTRKVAKVVLDFARAMVSERTGTLRDSLKVRAGKRNRKSPWMISTSVKAGGDTSLFTGDGFYGGFLELGTKDRVTKSGHKTGKIDSSRWAFSLPALFAYQSTKLDLFKSSMADWVRDQHRAANP